MKLENAKMVAKLLRKNGVRCGVIKGNGTTVPINPSGFPAYIVNEPKWVGYEDGHVCPYIYYDHEIGKKIAGILKTKNIPFEWGGDASDGIKLVEAPCHCWETYSCDNCKKEKGD